MNHTNDFILIKMKAEMSDEWICKMSLLHETVLRCIYTVLRQVGVDCFVIFLYLWVCMGVCVCV